MDSPRLNDAVAARVVAWHNRHPLARRIGAAQVHSVGYVVLPFAAPAPAAGAAPAAPGDGATGSLRERALARARQGGDAALPPPPPKALAATAMPSGAQANFDENFIAPLTPRQVARWARRHGRPLPAVQPAAGAPLREVLALPLPAGTQPLQVVVLTAAIEIGKSRRRVLLDAGDGAAVLGRRVPNVPRAGLLGLLLAAAVGAALLRPPVDPLAPLVAAAAPAASAPAETPPMAEPVPAAQAARPAAMPVADAPLLAVHASLDQRPPESPAAAASAASVSAVAVAASAAPAGAAPVVAAASAPLDVEPRLGRIDLPALGLPRGKQAKADARDAWLGAMGVPAMPPLAAAASAAVAQAASAAASAATVAAAPPPQAAESALQPAAAATFAVASRMLRTRAEAEQVRDAMHGLLRIGSHGGNSGASGEIQVEILPQGDDFRVVGWPFGARGQAEKARTVLVSRGMRVEVLAF